MMIMIMIMMKIIIITYAEISELNRPFCSNEHGKLDNSQFYGTQNRFHSHAPVVISSIR
jgi:hypothetical protein